MKYSKKLISAFFGMIITCLTIISSKSITENNYFITPLIKSAKSFLSFAQLPYCNLEVINALSCPLCSHLLDASYKVQEVISTTYEKREFKTVILKSNKHSEIVVSFGGPKLTKDTEFYSAVYKLGYAKFRNVQVEQIFTNVYQSGIQTKLRTSLSKILKTKNMNKFKTIFIGHGFGGSLATLAAYDLFEGKVIRSRNSPLVYSYGQLKIGDNSFVDSINKKIKVVRIIKNSDLAPVLSNCNYVQSTGKWDCSGKQEVPLGPQPKSPADENKTYNPVTFAMAYSSHPMRSSFLEKKTKISKKQVDLYYGGVKHDVYYRHTDDNKFMWQPIGSEVIFSKSFKKYQVCAYTKGGNGMCESIGHKYFDAKENSNYFHKKIDEC